MARLILLNGPPASGKSTLARRWAAARPLSLVLDIDVVRSLLGAWSATPDDAGLAARALAVAMARTHLRAGHDVIVPQFLARDEFVTELETLADDEGARFVELALITTVDDTLAAFAARTDAAAEVEHRDAAFLVERAGGATALAAMHARYTALIDTRPAAVRIGVARGDVEASLARVTAAIER
jgi:predicted kinase